MTNGRSARRTMPGHTHIDSRAPTDRALAWLRGDVGDIMLASGAWATLLGAPRDVAIALFVAGLPVGLVQLVRRRLGPRAPRLADPFGNPVRTETTSTQVARSD